MNSGPSNCDPQSGSHPFLTSYLNSQVPVATSIMNMRFKASAQQIAICVFLIMKIVHRILFAKCLNKYARNLLSRKVSKLIKRMAKFRLFTRNPTQVTKTAYNLTINLTSEAFLELTESSNDGLHIQNKQNNINLFGHTVDERSFSKITSNFESRFVMAFCSSSVFSSS